MNVTGLTISQFDAASWQAAQFASATQVNLPVAVTNVAVSGRYNYSQPCAYYDMGKKASHTTTNGTGSMSQSVSSGQLVYVLNVQTSPTVSLTFASASVSGKASVHVSPDSSLPGWLDSIARFLTGDAEMRGVRDATNNAFTTAQFSNQMVSLLNAKVQTLLAARAPKAMLAAAAPANGNGQVDGLYRLTSLVGSRRLTVGMLTLSDGELRGSDLRRAHYVGTYRIDPATQQLAIDAAVQPPGTNGKPKTGNGNALSLQVPIGALHGEQVKLTLPSTIADANKLPNGEWTASLERVGDA
jgi:hypothetical protein